MIPKTKKKKTRGGSASKPKLVERLDRVFSEYVRLRDSFATQSGLYFRCISCGRILPYADADCGHYVNRRHMATRFDEANCNAQCRSCNRFDEGNIYNYRRGLVAKIGEARVQLLESRKNDVCRYAPFELEAMTAHYRAKVKRLKEEQQWNAK